jgi:hypothetical protein
MRRCQQPAEPKQQKPSTWEHDSECPNYVAVEDTDDEGETGEDEEEGGEEKKGR